AGILRPHRRAGIAALSAAHHHLGAVGCERGLEVMTGLGRDRATLAAGSRGDAHAAEAIVVPGGVDDRRAVTRERRVELDVVVLRREPLRRAVRQVAYPESAERL